MEDLLRRADIARHHPVPGSWQRVIHGEFEGALTSTTRPFPCIFGAAGLKADQLRFSFQDEIDACRLAQVLARYLTEARNCGPNTSLVVFEQPRSELQTLATYEQRFWALLRDVARSDPTPWPAHVPPQLDDPLWEFCFAGEPVFVVCNTPAHVLRQSRRASTFMLTFQPRWVFDSILGTDEAAARSIQAVSDRLQRFDLVARCPVLGRYGDSAVREWAQYFLPDENVEPIQPFNSLQRGAE